MQGKAPQVRMDEEHGSAMAVLELIKNDINGNVTAVHDLSAGGLGVAISEMAISGGLGARIDLSKVPADETLTVSEILFSESHGRYLVTVKKDVADEILNKIKSNNVPAAIIGQVNEDKLVMNESISIPVEKLKKSYTGVIEKFMA